MASHGQRLILWKHSCCVDRLEAAGFVVVVRSALSAGRGRLGRSHTLLVANAKAKKEVDEFFEEVKQIDDK